MRSNNTILRQERGRGRGGRQQLLILVFGILISCWTLMSLMLQHRSIHHHQSDSSSSSSSMVVATNRTTRMQKKDRDNNNNNKDSSITRMPGVSSPPSSTTTSASRYYYWRFDEAAPPVHRAVTHYLPSIPQEHRVPPALPSSSSAFSSSTTKKKKTAAATATATATLAINKNNNWTEYVQNSSNVYPQKTHLFEINPSIVRLPVKLRQQLSAMLLLSSSSSSSAKKKNPQQQQQQRQQQQHDSMDVYYLSSYRVTHVHNCFPTDIKFQMMSGGRSWNVQDQPPFDNYLGLALLDSNLNIVVDTVVTLANDKNNNHHDHQTGRRHHHQPPVLGRNYQDFRLFVLPKNKKKNTNQNQKSEDHQQDQDQEDQDQQERLYLTTRNYIAELFLTIGGDDDNNDDGNDGIENNSSSTIKDGRKQEMPEPPAPSTVRLPLAFSKEDAAAGQQQQQHHDQSSLRPSLHVWLSRHVACPVYGTYEVTDPTTKASSRERYGSSKNLLYFVDPSTNATMVSHFPRGNPHDVRWVDLETKCRHQNITPPPPRFNATLDWEEIPPSFHTIDEQLYQGRTINRRTKKGFYMPDRGSACCVWIPDVRSSNSTTSKRLLVAVVHPKTIFPGKILPKGVIPNSYFSRFIAIEPTFPYRIVARSGLFCLGYSEESDSGHPLWSERFDPLTMGGVSFDCPRITFVTGMVDKVIVVEEEEETTTTTERGEHHHAAAAADDDDDDLDSMLVALRRNNSKVILSYGVSDCISRFVEMSKLDIVQRLFPEEMIM